MSDLVVFLRARYADEARAARDARGKRWHIGNAIDPTMPCNVHEFPTVRLIADNCGWLEAEHIARWNPEHVLAEVDAKRRIIDEHEGIHSCGAMNYFEFDDEPCPTLSLLALPYADHPDYRQEWRP